MVVCEDIIVVFLYNDSRCRCFYLQRVNCCTAGWTSMDRFSGWTRLIQTLVTKANGSWWIVQDVF
jgi:hypothetical protein